MTNWGRGFVSGLAVGSVVIFLLSVIACIYDPLTPPAHAPHTVTCMPPTTAPSLTIAPSADYC